MDQNYRENYFTNFFSTDRDISIISTFVYCDDVGAFSGEISVKHSNKLYQFEVSIPRNYPNGTLRFIYKSAEGLAHQNYDGSLCLHVPYTPNIQSKLEQEIKKLKNWIRIYAEGLKKDAHYEYPTGNIDLCNSFIFSELPSKFCRLKSSQFGTFAYSEMSSLGVQGVQKGSVYLCQDIGGKKCIWSEQYKSLTSKQGLWVFLSSPPTCETTRKVDWFRFIQFPKGFKKYARDFLKEINNERNEKLKEIEQENNYNKKTLANAVIQTIWGVRQEVILAIGYCIPSANNKHEIHWEAIKLDLACAKHRMVADTQEKLKWCNSINSSYERFFGRGALCNQIRKSKILVIGLGATGSAVVEIFVRGGVRHLTISDNDIIEPGNVCRSFHSFQQTSSAKVMSLKDRIVQISPFIDVDVQAGFPTVVIDEFNLIEYQEMKEKLDKFDIIIDCTANKEVLFMLSQLSLNVNVISISITDKSKQLVCVNNAMKNNMYDRLNQMLYSFGSIGEPSYQPGTGCWSRTFRASFVDINRLLFFAMHKINKAISQGSVMPSFSCYEQNESIICNFDITYSHPSTGLRLVIESGCFNKIINSAWRCYPKEYGGILVGNYINDGTCVVISDSILPENFTSTEVYFSPDNVELSRCINDIRKSSHGSITYVGEWHCHPDGTTEYSNRDFRAIKSLAESKTVNANNPILCIIAGREGLSSIDFYCFVNGELTRFVRD